jgi:hypothetical protein
MDWWGAVRGSAVSGNESSGNGGCSTAMKITGVLIWPLHRSHTFRRIKRGRDEFDSKYVSSLYVEP